MAEYEMLLDRVDLARYIPIFMMKWNFLVGYENRTPHDSFEAQNQNSSSMSGLF